MMRNDWNTRRVRRARRHTVGLLRQTATDLYALMYPRSPARDVRKNCLRTVCGPRLYHAPKNDETCCQDSGCRTAWVVCSLETDTSGDRIVVERNFLPVCFDTHGR